MNYGVFLKSPVTGTLWIWEKISKSFSFDRTLLEHNNLQWEWVIKSLNDYENTNIVGQGYTTLKKLKELKKNLSIEYSTIIDPIEYLIQLYYWEWLSVESIFERVNNKWLHYSEKWWCPSAVLTNLFKKSFKWELRDRATRSEIWEKRRISTLEGRINKLRTTNQKALEETKEITSLFVSFLSWKYNNDIKLNNEELAEFSIKSNWKKVVYLLDKYYSINLNQFVNLHRVHKLSWNRLSIIINELLKNIPKELTRDLNITERVVRIIIDSKNN